MSSGVAIKHTRSSGQRRDAKHNGKSLLSPTLGKRMHASSLSVKLSVVVFEPIQEFIRASWGRID